MRTTTPAPRLIPVRVHAALDYLVGALLCAAPWLFGFADAPIAMAVAVCMGSGAIVYSLFTRYPTATRVPLSAYGVIPFNAHLALDLASGLFLIASPWLCMFASRIVWPHVTVGLLEVGVTLLTGFQGSTAAEEVARAAAVGGDRYATTSDTELGHSREATGRTV